MRIPIIIFFVMASLAGATQVNIIPQPVSITPGKGEFILSATTKIYCKESSNEKSVDFFNNYLKTFYGFSLKKTSDPNQINIIFIGAEYLTHNNDQADNSYYLQVEKNKITINSLDPAGFFYGIQTLIQLLPVPDIKNATQIIQLRIPQLTISDYPRFAWRGLHLDVSRHFFPVDYIKKYIDYIAMHKMNYFHWHLTDDQGWRIEIKKYPKLTSVGGWRDGTIIGRYPGTGNDHQRYGGFYTQEQIKEVVKYAADRYITVIPEIEMPGHSMAALAAYPQLGTTPDSVYKVAETWGINGVQNNVLNPSEYTFNFLQDVLDEVMALFPAQYIHIGGDECDKRWWHQSAFCQQLMKDKGIKDEEGLQSYFIQRMEKYINSKGRKIIGWDEILEGGLAQNATVMSWRGEDGGIAAAKQDHDVVMTPGNPVYFDHTQSQNEDSVTIGGYNPIENVYAYEPIPAALNAKQAEHVLGAQANMWTEYMGNIPKVEYMLFPRLSALSEVLWTPKEKKNWDDFQKRLMTQFKRYDLWNANYSRAYFDLKTSILPTADHIGVMWKLESKLSDSHIMYMNEISPIMQYDKPIVVKKTHTYSAALYSKDNQQLAGFSQKFYFSKSTGKNITLTNPPDQKYPGDGAFTLVNGVISEKGFARSREYLGFNGTDCEATIDLGESTLVSFIVVHALNRKSSWIWRPLTAEAWGSGNGKDWYSLKMTDDYGADTTGSETGRMILPFRATYARYVKVKVSNWGTVPAGNPGAGNKPWLFVDEIEVDGPGEAELNKN